jgi:hypothetical protein
MRKLALLAAAAFAATVATPASAATATYSLSVSDPAASLGSGPFGTITVTENGDGTLTFVETLLNGARIHGGNDNHDAAAFSLIGDPNLTITGLTAGFTTENLTSGTSDSEPPFGNFQTSIVCTTACGPGYGGGFVGPLTFTVAASGGSPLTLASLGYNVYNGTNIYFTSDIVIANGNTGNVGATLSTPAVPEPATWAMMLIGFGATGVAMRRTRRQPKALAQLA